MGGMSDDRREAMLPSAERSEFAARELAAELVEIVGRDQVRVGAEARQRYPGDMSWLTYIHAAHGRPLAQQDVAVTPRTREQVAAVLKFASRKGIPVTPVGGGSGVQGAANADRGGLVIDLGGMRRLRHVDPVSLTCTVEPGMNVAELEGVLNAQGLSFTHYPASAEWASVGGCVAARGSGVLSTKHGTMQDHVLSLEVVAANGDIIRLPPVPRHGVGPELTQSFVGSECCLGIVTAITVKLRPLPKVRRFVVWRFDSLDSGIEAGRRIMVDGLLPSVMRLYDRDAAMHSLERAVQAGLDSETAVLVFDGQHERLVDAEVQTALEIGASLGARTLDPRIGQDWWDRRYTFYHPPFAPQLPQIWCTMDVVADFAHIGGVYRAVTSALREAVEEEHRMTVKTHLSHWYPWGAMIYPRVTIPRAPDTLERALELHDRVVRVATLAALKAGAAMNDHHGVGLRLGPYMAAQLGDEGMRLLESIKSALDPARILCPGKLGLRSPFAS